MKIQDASSVRDSSSVVADTSPISDKSLRPPPEGGDPAIRVKRMPDTGMAAAVLADTTPVPALPDSLPPAPISSDETSVLRRELGVPVAGIAAKSLHDTFNELRGGTRPHEALDIMAARGTPVLSAANGRVLKLFNSKPGGLMVYAVDSTGRYILKYGHLDAYAPGLVDGQPLMRGQQIGIVGTTGNAAGGAPHLHFAMARAGDLKKWWLGAAVNPFPFLTP
ncbi:MAG: M23 family metallopeptidase [Gemmatimonadota bacterium]|nr:M23 family metallopeptidase [Gemmatimonadota bacterium]